MILFSLRVLKLYFRDKTAVFFSLLSSFIIIGLYILFLGDTFTNSFPQIENIKLMMDQWVMAGLLATSSVSTTIAAFSIMVNDTAMNLSKDFYCTPVKKRNLVGGYFIAAFIIGLSLSLVTLLFAQIYILINGGSLFTFYTYLKIILILVVVVFMNASMMFFISSFFKTNNSFSTASTIVGTLIGFLTGIYVPIGSLPEMVQWIIKIFPTSQGVVLLRQVMMESTMSEAFVYVPEKIVLEIKEILGITFQVGDITLSMASHYIYLIVFTIIFFIGISIRFHKK